MTGLLLAALAFLPQAPAPAAADSGAFLEMRTARTEYYAGEVFTVSLRLGVDARFLDTRMLQPFRRQLDLPVQVEVPWLEAPPEGVRILPPREPPDAIRRTFALNGSVVPARVLDTPELEDRTAVVLDVRLRAQRSGTLELRPAVLHYAFAARFREDLIGGRVAEDRQEAAVEAPALQLSILSLPEESRPREFQGAVGQFSVEARADPVDLAIGQHLRLQLTVRGEGDLQGFAPPSLADLEGFHVYGWIEEHDAGPRRVTYDLAPLAPVLEIPPLPFAYFDPGPPPAYRRVETRALPLRVHAPEAAPQAEPEVPGGTPDLPVQKPLRPGRSLLIPAVLVLLGAGAGFLAGRLRRSSARRSPASTPGAAHDGGSRSASTRALARFHARTREGPGDPGEALAEYLAAQLDTPVPAVIAPDLARRLTRRGVPADLAQRCARTLESLVAARYGGLRTIAPPEVVALVASLHPFLEFPGPGSCTSSPPSQA